MIEEAGQVVTVGVDHLWVETIQASTCASCVAETGCGQRLLSKLTGKSLGIRVLLNADDKMLYRAGDVVHIGIPEDVVVKGSLLAYGAPLLGLLGGAWFGQMLFSADGSGDGWVALMAALGLGVAGTFVRVISWRVQDRRHLQPTLMAERLTGVGEFALRP